MNDPFAKLGLAMVRFRWVVLLVWIAVMPVAGALGASKAATVLKGGGFILPGSDSDKAGEVLSREFNNSTNTSALVVLRSPTMTVDDPAYERAVMDAAKRLSETAGVRAVLSFYQTRNASFVSPDRRTTYLVASLDGDDTAAQKKIEDLREALHDVTALEHYVTGQAAIGHDLEETSEKDLRQAEFITIPLVVILLLLVFRTIVSAAIPLVLGACSVVPGMAILYAIGTQTDLSIFALNVTSMLGLGLGIDFSLIVVNRFREELQAGRDPRSAVAVTMATAGRSITYSGLTVILGMFVMTLLLNLMLVRSMSLAVMLVATTALLAGLTLLPALLGILGRRIEWLPVLPRKKAQSQSGGFWYRLSHAIMRRPWIWLGVSILLLLVLAFPARNIETIGATAGVLPQDVESVKGSNAMNEAFGANRLTPIQIVIETEDQNGIWRPEFLEALSQLEASIKADARVQDVTSIFTLVPELPRDQVRGLGPQVFTQDPGRAAGAAQYVNLSGANDTALITIISKSDLYSDTTKDLVRDLRESIIPGVSQLRAAERVLVGGETANFIDLNSNLYGRFPYLVLAVMALTFIMLMMFFQSLFLPLKAILMNLASIVATYGALVLIFQHGWGKQLIGLEPLGAINSATPVILFVILLGLSTDYEVFMLSRVKEYYHETGNNEEAVAAGLENTAQVITAAGLILIGTFGSFGLADVVVIKELGIGLAIGVLIDSTIVRAIMVPASMRLMGDRNWWMPAWLKRIVPELREGPAPDLAPAPTGSHAPAPAPANQWPPQMPQPQPALPPLAMPPVAPRVGSPSPPPALRPMGWTAPPGGASPGQAAPPQSAGPPMAPRQATIGQLRPTGTSIGTELIVLPKRRPLRIGRSSEAELWLFDPRISRNHARIDYYHDANRFVVTDLNSVNGVYVNGRRVVEPTPLSHGDRIEIGTTGEITFVFEALTDAPPPLVAARPGG